MSGHSKWATTKHQKAITDAKRAKNFTKLYQIYLQKHRKNTRSNDG